MMQDYVFPADPAVARRLVALAQVTTTEITLEIERLALTGLIAPDVFAGFPDLSQAQQSTIQQIIDYKLRGVVLADNQDEARYTVLVAAIIQGVRPIIVCTRKPRPWKVLAEHFGLTMGVNPLERPDVLIVEATSVMRQDVVEPRRDGLLIIEHTDRSDYVHGAGDHDQAVVKEFARTVIIANFGSLTRTFHSWTRQCDIALKISLEYLWPNGALGILDHTPGIVAGLKRRGFKKFRAADLYFMFNVVPDLLGDRGPR
jgi:hypothetical protein